ncbi:DUF4102 domain-containing protein [Sphingomonas sp. SFZ2018-12]|nr:DUF4102 domain-containing protein [Sphingomonas sp. SFZ2018-12]
MVALNDAKVKAAKPLDRDYKLADSGQLYLMVTRKGTKLWRMNYRFAGKQKTLAFGAYPVVTLTMARERRDEAKRLLLAGQDPAETKRQAAERHRLEQGTTFEQVAREWYAKNVDRWAERHADDVIRSLERDIFPHFGDEPIARISAQRVLKVLEGIENRGSIETAKRIRQRVSGVFAYGVATGLCENDPAAPLRKALRHKPPAKRQPAVTDLAGAREVLARAESTPSHIVTKLGLRLLALTAVRPGELRGARWDEFEDVDWTGQRFGPFRPIWRIPAARMKGTLARKGEDGGDHLVPLSHQAVDLLMAMRSVTGRLPLVFPNMRHGHQPMSENAIGYLLNRAGYHGRHVPHGWRAAFSTIMNERAKQIGRPDDRAVIDLMLAHVPKDKVESAYNRAAFMERRRQIAQEWADLLMVGRPGAAELMGLPYRD